MERKPSSISGPPAPKGIHGRSAPRSGEQGQERRRCIGGKPQASSYGWRVFESEAEREIAENEARYLRSSAETEEQRNAADELMDSLLTESSLSLPGFCKEIELRFPTARFSEHLASEDVDKSFNLYLVAENFGYVLAKVRELLVSGVVTHCSLDLSVSSLKSSIPAERHKPPT